MMVFSHIALIMLTALISTPALAYISPGPGLTMIGSLVALFVSIIIAVLMVLLWPMRLFYKRWKARKCNTSSTADNKASTQP